MVCFSCFHTSHTILFDVLWDLDPQYPQSARLLEVVQYRRHLQCPSPWRGTQHLSSLAQLNTDTDTRGVPLSQDLKFGQRQVQQSFESIDSKSGFPTGYSVTTIHIISSVANSPTTAGFCCFLALAIEQHAKGSRSVAA